MILDPISLLLRHQNEITRINTQRQWWLNASSVVFVSVLFLIFGWEWIDHFDSKILWWFITSCMLIITVNWWYWTMRVIRIVINHRITEYKVLKSLIDELHLLRADLKYFKDQHVDMQKK